MNIMRKAGTFALASMCALTPVASVPVFAATSATDSNNTAVSKDLKDSDIIDYSKTGSLTIHKYDITSAEAAGSYVEGRRIANGEKDTILEDTMKDYAIEGVQFTYLRVGDIETYSDTKNGNTNVEVVYEIPTALAKILELNPHVGTGKKDAYDMTGKGVAKKCNKEGVLHYTSTQLSDALKAILDADNLAAKSALEEYLYSYGTQDDTVDGNTNVDGSTGVGAVNLPKTDKNGYTHAENLELGLYLVVETEVPEQVTTTVNPWFVSLPFTNMTGSQADTKAGGDYWLYNMDCYPKNQTGNPTLDKSVRNAYSSTAATDKNGTVNKGNNYDYSEATGQGGLIVFNDDTNAANKADKDENKYVANRGGYTKDGVNAGKDGAGYSTDYEYRDTQTASAGDVLDYILVSKLPHISSKASFLSEYTFTDILSKGITYNKDVKIAFYNNAADANANNTAKAVELWNVTSGNQTQDYVDISVTDGMTGHQWKDGSTQMTVKLTEKGLNIINGEGVTGNNKGGQGIGAGTSANSMSDMYMVVYYTATVNSDATLTLGDDGNENDVVLTWTAATDDTAVGGYRVYVDGTPVVPEGKDFNPVNGDYTTAETTYTVTGLDLTKDHTFTIQAGDTWWKAAQTMGTYDKMAGFNWTVEGISTTLEAKQEEEKEGFVEEDGRLFWNENGVKQGTEGRGKEIYAPVSDGWYWLDAVDGGNKAVSKDVYQESYAGAYADREDGTGKWVRYDENGRMIKGWSEQNGSRYYFDLVTGAMAKGTTVIDGQPYTFSWATGTLQE